MENINTKLLGVSTRLPQRLAEQLATVARENGRSVASEIRRLVESYVSAQPDQRQ